MRANYLADFQELASTDDWEDATATWSTVTQGFIEFATMTSKELVDARQVHAEITHKIRTPWQNNITADMRISWNDRTFHILGPPRNAKEGNRRLEMMCVERK